MKRFVTYLYEYERGLKTKNTGFIRVDIRERFVNMEICIRKFLRDGEEGSVYALVNRRGLHGIELGNIKVHNGQGDLRLQLLAKNLLETEFSMEDVVGIGICFHNQSYLASCWTDAYAEDIGRGAFAVWKKDISKVEKKLEEVSIPSQSYSDKEEEMVLIRQELLEKQEAENLEISIENKNIPLISEENTMELELHSIQDTDSEMQSKTSYTYRKLDLPQIREIPGQDLHYERNAFLIHGFWNYGFLILKTEVENHQKKISLGVPGVYERQEAAMAMVFGFPKFETFPQKVIEMPVSGELTFTKEEIEKNQQPREKSFGCWFTEVM